MKAALPVAFVLGAAACKPSAPPTPTRMAPPPTAPVATGPADMTDPHAFHPLVRPPDFAAPPRADTMNGDRNGPKQADFDAVEADGQRRVQACFDTMKWAPDAGNIRVGVSFSVGNDGKVQNAQIDTTAPADIASCIRGAVEGMTFPKFEGNAVRTSFQTTFGKGG